MTHSPINDINIDDMKIDDDAIPLPPELQSLSDHETCCKYCGISYLVYNEFRKLIDERNKLKSDLQASQEENNGSKEKLQSTDELLAAADEGKRLAEARCDSLNAELESARQLHSEFVRESSSSNSEAQNHIKDLYLQLDESNETINSLKKALVPGFSDRLAVVHESIASLRNGMNSFSLQWIGGNLPDIIDAMKHLSHKYEEELVNERANSAKKVQEIEWKLQDERAQSDELRNELNGVNERYSEHEASAKQFMKESDDAQSRLRAELVETGLEKRKFEAQLKEQLKSLKKSEDDLSRIEEKEKTLVRELKESKKENFELSACLEGYREEIFSLKSDVKKAEDENTTLRRSISMNEREIEDWKGRYRDQEKHFRDLERTNKDHIEEMSRLAGRIEFLEREVETRQLALEEETQRWKTMETSHKSQLSDVQSGLAERMSLLTRSGEEKIADLQGEIGRMKESHGNTVSVLKAEISSLKIKAETNESEAKTADMRLREAQEAEAACRSMLDAGQEKIAKLEQSRRQLSSEVSALKEKVKEKERHDSEREREQDNGIVSDLQSRIRQLEATLKERSAEVDVLQSTVHAECEERQELSSVIARLQHQLSTMNSTSANSSAGTVASEASSSSTSASSASSSTIRRVGRARNTRGAGGGSSRGGWGANRRGGR